MLTSRSAAIAALPAEQAACSPGCRRGQECGPCQWRAWRRSLRAADISVLTSARVAGRVDRARSVGSGNPVQSPELTRRGRGRLRATDRPLGLVPGKAVVRSRPSPRTCRLCGARACAAPTTAASRHGPRQKGWLDERPHQPRPGEPWPRHSPAHGRCARRSGKDCLQPIARLRRRQIRRVRLGAVCGAPDDGPARRALAAVLDPGGAEDLLMAPVRVAPQRMPASAAAAIDDLQMASRTHLAAHRRASTASAALCSTLCSLLGPDNPT
jgi:hypothetical protein